MDGPPKQFGSKLQNNMTKKSIKYSQITCNLNQKAALHLQFEWRQQNDIFTIVTESNVKVFLDWVCVIHVCILVKYPNMLLLFSKVRLLSCLKMLLDKRMLSRGGYTILWTTKMVVFMTEVNTWKLLTVFTNISTSDVVWVPGPRLA